LYAPRIKKEEDKYRKMVMNSYSTLTNTPLVFILSGLLVFVAYNHALGSTSLPSSPPEFPPIPQPEPSATQRSVSTNQTCILTPSLIEIEGTPQQIEGPYFVDGMPNRSDIRSDTSNDSLQEGIPLRLILRVYDVDDIDGDGVGSCSPLKDTKVDIWHSNSQGVYSGVQAAETAENDFLRGYQMTDENGTVQFTTIYPGWYEGRAIHIHIKVRDYEGSNETLEWTSQFYLNNSINELIHAQPPYSEHGPVPLTNEDDFIYTGPSSDGLIQNNTGQHLMLNVKEDAKGHVGIFNVGINATRSTE
jgi:protocatechuate 3,4-dioxygenase beta subunit